MKYLSAAVLMGAIPTLASASVIDLLRALPAPIPSTAGKPTTVALPSKGASPPTMISSTYAAPPPPGKPTNTPQQGCLSSATATALVNGYASLLTSYNNTTANALLTADFTDTSQSINWLAGYPLDGYTFPNRAAFIAGQGSQPSIGFNVISIDAVGCTTVAFRWNATLYQGAQPVKGINILYAVAPTASDKAWQIQSMYSEFNSALWNAEIGGVCANATKST